MLNKDLINSLKEFNPEANVTLTTSEDICISYITEGGADKSNTPHIFIEECDICSNCFYESETYCTFYNQECSDVEECYQHLNNG